jgi:hypothetical protein
MFWRVFGDASPSGDPSGIDLTTNPNLTLTTNPNRVLSTFDLYNFGFLG